LIASFSLMSSHAFAVNMINQSDSDSMKAYMSDKIYQIGVLAKAYSKCQSKTLAQWDAQVPEDKSILVPAFNKGYKAPTNAWASESCSALLDNLARNMAAVSMN
jgi:hypothetical protein